LHCTSIGVKLLIRLQITGPTAPHQKKAPPFYHLFFAFLKAKKRWFLGGCCLFFLFYFAAMENFNWNLALENYWLSYYTMLIMQIISIIVIIKGATAKYKNPIIYILVVYAAASFLQTLITNLAFGYFTERITQIVASTSISLFIIIETTCCYLLLTKSSLHNRQKQWLKLLLVSFYAFELVYLAQVFFTERTANIESFVQLPLMVIFCTIYYYNLLSKPPQDLLLQTPLFWAIGGIALIAFSLLPLNIALNYVSYSKSLFHLSLIIPATCYSLVFIFHLKAIQCSQKQPQS
jgi:hypothetical protein